MTFVDEGEFPEGSDACDTVRIYACVPIQFTVEGDILVSMGDNVPQSFILKL